MRQLLFVFGLCLIGASACKKNDDVSQVVTVSYPTITLTGDRFYSIRPGEAAPTIGATAYDSTLREAVQTNYDPAGVDNATPGLYVLPITAKNKNGYETTEAVYIAVTSVPDDYDLSGAYLRAATQATVNVTKVKRGIYETDDVGGAPSLPVTAYFAQIDDSVLSLPEQPTEVGTLSATDAFVRRSGTDTLIQWKVVNGSFGTALRTFVKIKP